MPTQWRGATGIARKGGHPSRARISLSMLRRVVTLWLLLLACASAQPELELPRTVRFWLDTRPSQVEVYRVGAGAGPAERLGTSQQRLTLEVEPSASEWILLLECPGYQPTTVRLSRAQLTEGARLGPYEMAPSAGQGWLRLLRENRFLLLGWLLVGLGYLGLRLSLRRLSRLPPPLAPASIGPVLFSSYPVAPPDLPLRRRIDPGFALGCSSVVGLGLGALIWAGSHLAAHLWGSLPLSLTWLWLPAAWICLATVVMELVFGDAVELAQFVGERGLARFRFTCWLDSELVLFQEIVRVEEVVSPQERDSGHHPVEYRWLTADGQERMRLSDIQGAPGFASEALAAWRRAKGSDSARPSAPEPPPDPA